MANFCGNCGAQAGIGVRFCSNCGAGIVSAAPTSDVAVAGIVTTALSASVPSMGREPPEAAIAMRQLSCSNCGGSVIFSPQDQVTVCSFCNSKFQVDLSTPTHLLPPNFVLPFSVTQEQFRHAVLRFLASGDYTPDDIIDAHIIGDVNGTYVPCVRFSGSYEGHYSALSVVKYEVKNGKGDRIGTREEATPVNGTVKGQFNIIIPTLAQEDEVLSSFAMRSDTSQHKLKKFDIGYLQGYTIGAPSTISEGEAWEKQGYAIVREMAKSAALRMIPGNETRDFNLHFDSHQTDSRIMVPVWTASYNYKGSQYRVFTDGADVAKTEGTRPEDQERKARVAKLWYPAMGFAAACCLNFGVSLTMDDHNRSAYIENVVAPLTWVFLAGLVVSLGVALYKEHKIISASKEIRQRALADAAGTSGLRS